MGDTDPGSMAHCLRVRLLLLQARCGLHSEQTFSPNLQGGAPKS